MLALYFDLSQALSIYFLLLLEPLQLFILSPHLLCLVLLLFPLPFTFLNQLSISLLAHLALVLKPGSLSFPFSLLDGQAALHLFLVEAQLVKLRLKFLVLADRAQLLLLYFELMRQELVLAARLIALLLPPPHAVLLALHDLALEHVELLARAPRVLLLLLLLHLLKHLLVCFELQVGDHLVLQARFVLVLLLSLNGTDFFVDLAMLVFSQALLLSQRCFDCCLNSLHMLKSSFAVQLVEPDPLLE